MKNNISTQWLGFELGTLSSSGVRVPHFNDFAVIAVLPAVGFHSHWTPLIAYLYLGPNAKNLLRP